LGVTDTNVKLQLPRWGKGIPSCAIFLVSSKATIKLEPEKWANAYWIPALVRTQLSVQSSSFTDNSSTFPHSHVYSRKSSNVFSYLTKSGAVVVQSDRTRNREDNIRDCFEKLATEIRRCVYFEAEIKQENVVKWDKMYVVTVFFFQLSPLANAL
jgi:peptidyl-tRNA hydrolase ICT1